MSIVPNAVEITEDVHPLPLGVDLQLVFVGGLTRRKGVPELLEALDMVTAGVCLRLVGGAGEDGEQLVRQLEADHARNAGRVHFEGELDDLGVREQLRSADVFVLPSKSEGTPVSLLEAMSEGRPVIVGDAGDMKLIVERAGCGLVLREVAAASIAAAIEEVLAKRSQLPDWGERGRTEVVIHYGYEAVAGRVTDALHSALRQ